MVDPFLLFIYKRRANIGSHEGSRAKALTDERVLCRPSLFLFLISIYISKGHPMKKKLFDFFQTKGAATTMEAAIDAFKARNPKAHRVSGAWKGAYPGDRNGRWVTIEMSYTEGS